MYYSGRKQAGLCMFYAFSFISGFSDCSMAGKMPTLQLATVFLFYLLLTTT
jgi:hypothetical protein